MTDKKKYYKLDDIGFVGTQKKLSAIEKKSIEKKTGDIFRAARAQNIDEYNEDLEAGNAEINRGELITAADLKKEAGKW